MTRLTLPPLLCLTLLTAFRDTPQPPLALGNTPAETRQLIEAALAGGTIWNPAHVTLPNGTIHCDRALRLPSYCLLEGSGKTVIDLPDAPAPFGDNCCLSAVANVGLGYGNAATFSGVYATVADASLFRKGDWCFSAKWDGYTTTGQSCRLHKVMGVSGNQVALDTPPAAGADKLNAAFGSVRCRWATLGNSAIVLSAATINWSIGGWLLITDGQSIANEMHGELREIVGITYPSVQLDRPIAMDLDPTLTIAVPIAPLRNIQLRNLNLSNSQSTQRVSFFAKFVDGMILDNVIDNGQMGFANCTRLAVVRSDLGTVGYNSSSECTLDSTSCRCWSLEEGCASCSGSWLSIYDGDAAVNPLQWGLGCRRCTLRHATITHSAGNIFHTEGSGHTVDDVTISGTISNAGASIAGDNVRISRLQSDRQLVFWNGLNQLGVNLKAPSVLLGFAGKPSSGRLIASDVGVVQPSAGWVVQSSSQ